MHDAIHFNELLLCMQELTCTALAASCAPGCIALAGVWLSSIFFVAGQQEATWLIDCGSKYLSLTGDYFSMC